MNSSGSLGLALWLAALAGWVDAAGVAQTHGIFVSFMSGNTTQLGAALAHGHWKHAGAIAPILALFIAGVTIGEWAGRGRGRSLVLWLEALSLAAGAMLGWRGFMAPPFLVAYPLVFAMGVQNATMQRTSGIGIGLTYVTGTLVQIGRTFAGARDRSDLPKFIALWLSLAAGAMLSALVVSFSAVAALAVAAAFAALVALVTPFEARS